MFSTKKARELIDEGRDLLGEFRDEAALERFREAFDGLKGNPQLASFGGYAEVRRETIESALTALGSIAERDPDAVRAKLVKDEVVREIVREARAAKQAADARAAKKAAKAKAATSAKAKGGSSNR